MTRRSPFSFGVLLLLSACVPALCAAEPSSAPDGVQEAGAREIRPVSVSSAPAAPLERSWGRRRSISERPAAIPVLPSPGAVPGTKTGETPEINAPAEPGGWGKKQIKELINDQQPASPAAPVTSGPVLGGKETLPVVVPPVPAKPVDHQTGARRSFLTEKPAAPRKVPPPPRPVKMKAETKKIKIQMPAQVPAEKAERYLQQARSAYNAGYLDEAEGHLDQCLAADPGNRAAREFKGKLGTLRERMLAVQEDVAEEYYRSADYFYQKGNLPEALLWIERSVKLNQKSPLPRMLHQDLERERAKLLLKVDRGDKKELEDGIRFFLDEDFDSATAVFRKLQRFYPDMNDFLSTSIIHSLDEKNGKRSREYIQEALENMKKERYKIAQEDLYLALEMDATNLYARLVLAQVNLELGSSIHLYPTTAVSVPSPKAAPDPE